MKRQNMTSLLGPFCLATLLVTGFSPAAVAAEEFKVGGEEGWRLPAANETEMYSRWASTMRFHIGDSLRFEYKNDSVMVVDKWGYYHCDSSHPISVFEDGDTVINLDRPDPFYFISSEPDHCKNGQRLMVEVISPHGSSPAPSPSSGVRLSSVATEMVSSYVVLIAPSMAPLLICSLSSSF